MNPIRVAIVGCGRVSDLHQMGYRGREDARIVAVCDSSRARAKSKAGEWEVEKVYTDYTQVLEDKEVDVVELLTPHHLHCPKGSFWLHPTLVILWLISSWAQEHFPPSQRAMDGTSWQETSLGGLSIPPAPGCWIRRKPPSRSFMWQMRSFPVRLSLFHSQSPVGQYPCLIPRHSIPGKSTPPGTG